MKRKMPTLNALKVFEVAATLGNFTRAADVLNVTQSAVSRQVRQLEDQLGEPLLIRSHHQLHMTDAGRSLLTALQQSFDRIELAVRSIRQKQHLNRLRVNAPPTFALRWLLPRMSRFKKMHPHLEVSLTSALRDTLNESGQLDCAIRFGNGEWGDVDSSLLMHEQHIAVCAPSLLRGRPSAPVQLHELPLLHVLAGPDRRYMTWTHWIDAAGIGKVDIDRGYEFDLLDMAIRAAIDGLGITIADRHMVANELADGRLVQFLDAQVEGHQSYWFVTRQEHQGSPVVEQFRAWLQAELRLPPSAQHERHEVAQVARDLGGFAVWGECHSFFE
ncbi:transcriptional regulator, LysR family [Dyella jiangningensis]|uniref:transcriptional regulator GcvA n=1 Tax=Dyella sp. AtDHG13 TaxID=1938897 RepID=UPI00088AE90C|nr:transcriptional regulator GcvA [Dyella sp. AtDHG13]PXV61811.1 LysR family transcriptional regulator [Dyella sp. AtDHG13]SDJ63072.1 transcriptional regulator, LysR family [Dyella jiangningensis]